MATIILSAVGTSLGGALGGGLLGLSSAVIGRAVGATLGRVIDQRILGQGSQTVETGRVERFRLTGASEGAPLARVHGRARVAGQVIWATRFREQVAESGGGKGGPPAPRVRSYSYSVSVAVALCEGEIAGIGRIWADGTEVAREGLNLRVYAGGAGQLPDPLIEAVEGEGRAPAYRGTAYVVLEDLDLGRFGNRMPQLNFEVFRPAPAELEGVAPDPARAVRAVALIPGTGEYALATTPVHYEMGPGDNRSANIHTPDGRTDLPVSLDRLGAELPACEAVSLVVCWFGDDLRCGECELRPKVEQRALDGVGMPWSVTGLDRAGARELAKLAGRPVYGGTPSDRAVIEAIAALREAGQAVTFYPFILMEQLQGNGRPDPYGGAEQPALPWRGRITLSAAPGQAGSPDTTAAAAGEVAAFFGTAQPGDFFQTAEGVGYAGPEEWSFRRFILHYAHLCAAAGGVEAFCIGSELRGLTQIRDADGFPAVAALRALAADVRAVLGPECKISYAADWSEYFGYHPQDGSGDLYFHLDPLWADENVDFIGIDNYMPLSDWREGEDHADAHWGSIYDLDYLRANVAGGEGYDWYYPHAEAREAQLRTPITDGAYGEPWVYRYKDLRGWWSNRHLDRIGGLRGQLVRDGSRPRDWAAAGGALLADEAGPAHGVLARPVRVTDAAGDALAAAVSGGFEAPEGAFHEISVFYAAGDSAAVRVLLPFVGARDGADWVDLQGAPGALAQVGTGAHEVGPVENRDHGGGVHECRLTVRWADSAAEVPVRVGPGGAVAGAHLLVLGVHVTSPTLSRTGWVPQSKPIRFTEYGCAAVDKGTNQPNRFLDAKSAESGLPHYSNGRRDDYLQMQYLRAVTSYYAEAGNNPVSGIYGAPMVDMSRAHVWAWDARPFPFFPALGEVWADGDNYRRGHWINGRASARSLAGLVTEVCRRSGLPAPGVKRLHGLVRGYLAGETGSGRAELQPLMLAYGFDAVERDGALSFRSRGGAADGDVAPGALAVVPEAEAGLVRLRAPEAEVAGRLRLNFVEAEGDYGIAAEEAVFPDEPTRGVAASELPLVLTRTEARAITERWLAEARVARETVRLALPPSRLALGPGDVLRLPGAAGEESFRIDRAETGALQLLEVVRVERGLYRPSDAVLPAARPAPFAAPVPTWPIFLDLPLLRGSEVPHAPHLASAARNWPGALAVYDSDSDDGYRFNIALERRAVVGVTETALPAAPPGRLDRGPALRLRLVSGALSSVARAALLNGANAAVIGDGSAAHWEVFQFERAELVAPDTWELSGRLRGQAGTDAVMPGAWPEGSVVVLLDGAPRQIGLDPAARGLERHYRIGPQDRPPDDASYSHIIAGFDGIGLRPYAPVHLRRRRAGADDVFSWIRRTRVDGDSWQGLEVPLGEERERYLLRVSVAGTLLREELLDAPQYVYSQPTRAGDGVTGAYEIAVAQVSDRFGPGPFRRRTIHG
jgi:hypothetical protein